jgi:cytochrome c
LEGKIEVHTDSPDRQVISTLNYTPAADPKTATEQSASITAPQGKHDLYFVFTRTNRPAKGNNIAVDWISFEKAK